ncbi:PRC-barrel domain-containing protein [Methanobacterium alkalithermotolerans]|uniref:PRC-barrel domain-containing protein n=1 Tax=Methanobacterium alkalithermotolerans TaxID=2731220 RepID=A0A8T8K5A9_9EURY|nr:PRC-barrel domain-containing protein [Methanobacterium alkalithermotolerans]QUH23778.1 PRC-barrel domain-containing protein [Methanobacterium alkalithermotolerans]RJS48282.1 MAG: hypothetical protein CIT03_09185 [Methanobacterium sp.]
MKASEFIGKTVIDKTGVEIGKVEDIIVKPKKCLMDRIIIGSGGLINKKHFSVKDNEIESTGDYVLLNMALKEIEDKLGSEDLEYIKKVETNFAEIQGKVVITQNGVKLGTVEDMVIKPSQCLIENIIVKSKSDLGKKSFMVGKEEIIDIKDFMVLNLDLDDVEGRII